MQDEQPEPQERPNLDDLDSAPVNLPAKPPSKGDLEILRERFAEVTDELESTKIEYNEYRRRNTASDILNRLIEPMADKIFWFMVWYCLVVAAILVLNACGLFANPVTEGVLQLLVGSTATTVLGLVGMVVAGIFNGARKQSPASS